MGNTNTQTVPCLYYVWRMKSNWQKKTAFSFYTKSIWDKSFNYPKRAERFQLQTSFFLFRGASKDHIEFVDMIEHWDRWTLHNIIDVMHIHHVKLMSIVSLWIFKNEFDQNANVSGSNVRVHNELVIWGDHWYSRQCSTNILETPSKCTQTHTHDRWWAATWNVDCKMNAARTQIFTQWYKMSKFDSPM